jgi:protein-tyrosine phosphatase
LRSAGDAPDALREDRVVSEAVTAIDLHCHVLPGIDDGPPTMEDAVALVRAAAERGTRTMVATPHVSWSWPENTAASIAGGVTDLQRALAEHGVAVEIVPGAEVALTRAMDLPDDELEGLRLGGGQWLLVECPSTPSAAGFEHELYSLRARGHDIALSHIERIPAFRRDVDLLQRLVDQGMLGSVTAGSFGGHFGRDVQKFSHHIVESGLVHNVASDAHDLVRRPPGIVAELEAAGLGSKAAWLADEVPAAMLDGSPIPPPPVSDRVKPRRRLGFRGRR